MADNSIGWTPFLVLMVSDGGAKFKTKGESKEKYLGHGFPKYLLIKLNFPYVKKVTKIDFSKITIPNALLL